MLPRVASRLHVLLHASTHHHPTNESTKRPSPLADQFGRSTLSSHSLYCKHTGRLHRLRLDELLHLPVRISKLLLPASNETSGWIHPPIFTPFLSLLKRCMSYTNQRYNRQKIPGYTHFCQASLVTLCFFRGMGWLNTLPSASTCKHTTSHPLPFAVSDLALHPLWMPHHIQSHILLPYTPTHTHIHLHTHRPHTAPAPHILLPYTYTHHIHTYIHLHSQTPHCNHAKCRKCPLWTRGEEEDLKAVREAGLRANEARVVRPGVLDEWGDG